ncbi:MAG: helix-turn-helix transcriptional regulator [Clostridia bacterium]|nr:helix-turn-helix transcriptional regulator [Clostridia bacterium]
MKSSNICKFINTPAVDILVMKNFIFETNKECMTAERALSNHTLFLVTSGAPSFVFGSELISAPVGTLIVAFSGECVRALPDEESEYMYISFSGGRAEELFRRFGISKARRAFKGNEGLIPVWRDSLFRAAENAVDLAAESSLLFAFSRLTAEGAERDDTVKRILSIMERDFSDSDFDLSTLANSIGYNSKYLSHLFKKQMNVSFSEHLRNLRIKHAVFLFDHGLESVKNVAYLSGFKDPLYFSGVFKRTVGITPKEYKNKVSATGQNTAE